MATRSSVHMRRVAASILIRGKGESIFFTCFVVLSLLSSKSSLLISLVKPFYFMSIFILIIIIKNISYIIWTASSGFCTYRLCEQRRFRRACASAQSRQNLRCSLIQAVNQEEPSDRKPDPWPFWMAGHAQLKFVMTECSKTQIRLTGLISYCRFWPFSDIVRYICWPLSPFFGTLISAIISFQFLNIGCRWGYHRWRCNGIFSFFSVFHCPLGISISSTD